VDLGKRIRARREELGIKQADLARAVDIQPQSLYRIEVGDVTNPGVELVDALARELKCTTDHLIRGTKHAGRAA
jgi:DNA-binding XRE family transcriptional regulator